MSLLLDTHALIFWLGPSEKLSASVRIAISETEGIVHVSTVSLFEIILKHRMGKLPVVERIVHDLVGVIAGVGFQIIPIEPSEAIMAASFTAIHRDPFDRMLAAQSIIGDLTLISSDTAIDQFGARRLW
jgi:PIN domain nuclease of toxin-antitoxin system